ncbi:MAG: NfeD family protein [Rhodospirillaceae bacterium]
MFEIEFWHWWVVAATFGALDILAKSGYFLGLGFSALLAGLFVFVLPDLDWQVQLFLFTGISAALIFRPRRLDYGQSNVYRWSKNVNYREPYIGRIVELDWPIVNGHGHIFIDNTLWSVEGSDMQSGTHVRILQMDGVKLIVSRQA